MHEKRTILIVDDETRILEFVRMNLELEGYRVSTAAGGQEALAKLGEAPEPDLVVLDVMMPVLDGFETLTKLREISSVPVIFLSAKSEEFDRILGLDLGADDYLSKPFNPRELVSRIRAVLRRTGDNGKTENLQMTVDEELSIDFDRRTADVRGSEVRLRPTEQKLLFQLVTNPGRLMTHETLLSRVWGPEYRDEHHYLRLYVTYLRQKLEVDPKDPKYIISERGLGYRFKEFDRSGGVTTSREK